MHRGARVRTLGTPRWDVRAAVGRKKAPPPMIAMAHLWRTCGLLLLFFPDFVGVCKFDGLFSGCLFCVGAFTIVDTLARLGWSGLGGGVERMRGDPVEGRGELLLVSPTHLCTDDSDCHFHLSSARLRIAGPRGFIPAIRDLFFSEAARGWPQSSHADCVICLRRTLCFSSGWRRASPR